MRIPYEDLRAAEVAKAQSLLKSVATLLEQTNDTAQKAQLLWELGYVHLREMETYREIR